MFLDDKHGLGPALLLIELLVFFDAAHSEPTRFLAKMNLVICLVEVAFLELCRQLQALVNLLFSLFGLDPLFFSLLLDEIFLLLSHFAPLKVFLVNDLLLVPLELLLPLFVVNEVDHQFCIFHFLNRLLREHLSVALNDRRQGCALVHSHFPVF